MNTFEKTNLVLGITQTIISLVTFALLIAHYEIKQDADIGPATCDALHQFEYAEISKPGQ
ncbi:MAG: hypothetical protein WA790_12560 [Sulfitobacter sp.]